MDGDCSWFNNPQFRVRSLAPTTIYVSIVPLRGANIESKESTIDVNSAPVGCITVVSYPITTASPHLWDATACEVCATEFVNGTGRIKGQESSIWKLNVLPSLNYQVVPSTLRRSTPGAFILRIFSRQSIVVESVDKLVSSSHCGSWSKETAGGALRTLVEGKVRENPRWCQNPQYHFSLLDFFGKEELNLKIVLRRTDINPALKSSAANATPEEPSIGLTICKAEYFYDAEELVIRNKGKSQLRGKPRENAMGEVTFFSRINPTSMFSYSVCTIADCLKRFYTKDFEAWRPREYV